MDRKIYYLDFGKCTQCTTETQLFVASSTLKFVSNYSALDSWDQIRKIF